MPPFSTSFEIPAEPELDLDDQAQLIHFDDLMDDDESALAFVAAYGPDGTRLAIPGYHALRAAGGWPHAKGSIPILHGLTAGRGYFVDTIKRDRLRREGCLPETFRKELHGKSYQSRLVWEAAAEPYISRSTTVPEDSDSLAPVAEETSAREQATDWLTVLLLWDAELGIKTRHDDWKAECMETYEISEWTYDRHVWGDAREAAGFERQAKPGRSLKNKW